MTLGLSNTNTNTSGLSLGAQQGYGAQQGFAQQGFAQQAPNTFMNNMMGGAGANQYYQQPVAPPSETEILSAMLGTIKPIEKFMISQNMPVFIEMMSNISAFSLLNVLKNCSFKIDDEGVMKLDVMSLPSDLQTLSAENIIAQLNTLQNVSQQAVTLAMQERDRIIGLSEQSLLQGALGAALQDQTFLENAGNATGGFLRSAFGLRPQ